MTILICYRLAKILVANGAELKLERASFGAKWGKDFHNNIYHELFGV